MNWDDVRIFLAVARSGQILGAARRLELNHATVSRRVAALEEALKTKLFRRLTTGSELTPAGERFLEVAERMEADMLTARAEISGEGDEVSGTVRIGAPDGFGVAFLAQRLGALTAQHADLKIQLVPVPHYLFAVAARGRHRHHHRAPDAKDGWSPSSWSTIRSACSPRAPMRNNMACRRRAPSSRPTA